MGSKIKMAAKIGTSVALALLAAGTASATALTFDTTKGYTNGLVSTKTYDATNNGTTVSMKVTGWHTTSYGGGYDLVSSASLGLWSPGIGVSDSKDSLTNEHQIDSVHGGDFVLLQFSKAVTLTGFGRAVYGIGSSSNSDAVFWGDQNNYYSSQLASWNSAIDLTGQWIYDPSLSNVAGGSTNNTATVNPGFASNLWLVGASFNTSTNHGFKLSSVTVDYTPAAGAVPEPATWAMMLVGFGAVGGALRRSRPARAALAA